MLKQIVNLFYELGVLKFLKRSGWVTIGIKDGESVADHALRTAQIGYILAELENYAKPDQVVTALVFHEIGESRIGDLNTISKKYLPKKNELLAVKDQVGDLYPEILRNLKALSGIKGQFGKILKDADLLETASTAKEYMKSGYDTSSWLDNIKKELQTKTGRKLFQTILQTDPHEWFKKMNI